jgi:hypothetical protein
MVHETSDRRQDGDHISSCLHSCHLYSTVHVSSFTITKCIAHRDRDRFHFFYLRRAQPCYVSVGRVSDVSHSRKTSDRNSAATPWARASTRNVKPRPRASFLFFSLQDTRHKQCPCSPRHFTISTPLCGHYLTFSRCRWRSYPSLPPRPRS